MLPRICFVKMILFKDELEEKMLPKLREEKDEKLKIQQLINLTSPKTDLLLHKKKEDIYKIKWEVLNEANMICIDSFISPKHFFARKLRNCDRLYSLHVSINSCVQEKQVEELTNIAEGAIGLAIYKDTKQYSRIKIYRTLSDTLVEVFFVDFGDFSIVESKSLLTMIPCLVNRLPFQAIECSLGGITKTLPLSFNTKLFNSMFDFTTRKLYSEVSRTVRSAKFTGGCHYVVTLYDGSLNINTEVRKKFPQCIS